MQWPCSASLVKYQFERRDELQEVFENILENHDNFDSETIHCADGYINLFSIFDFRFLLTTFNSIFVHYDVLKILQTGEMDVEFCMKHITQLCTTLEREGSNFDAIYEDTVKEVGVPRARRASAQEARTHYQQLYCRIIDSLLTQVRERFKDHERLMFLALLDPQQFTAYRISFPDTALASLAQAYRCLFDISHLKTELSVMYTIPDFEGQSPADLLSFLQQKGLTNSMHQLYRLACLVLTIPVCTASVGSTCSALKRIKTYCSSNNTGQARLSTMALLSIEKELLLELKSIDRLYEQAVAHFVKNNQTAEWILYSSSDRHLVPRMNQTEGEDNSDLVPSTRPTTTATTTATTATARVVPTVEPEPTPKKTNGPGTQFLQPSAIYSIPIKFVISSVPPKDTALMQPTVPGLSTTYVILPDNRPQPEVAAVTNSEPVRKRARMSQPDNPPTQPVSPPTQPVSPPSQPDNPPSQPDNPPSQPVNPPSQPDNPPSQPDSPPSQPVNTPKFDPVHVTKCLQEKLRKLVMNKHNTELVPWVKSITHHFWWSCQTSDGNVQELKCRWTSILQHICGIHTWQENGKERTCYHGNDTEAMQGKTKWLKKDSAAFKALSGLVLNFLK